MRGRPRLWGQPLSLAQFAAQTTNLTQTIALNQNRTPVQLGLLGGRYHASGLPLRCVILRSPGKPDAVVMSTDLSLTPHEVAGRYADRFAIEMTFRGLKQHFGLGDYQVWLPEALWRHVHLSEVACALTQLLTLRPAQQRPRAPHSHRQTHALATVCSDLSARGPTVPAFSLPGRKSFSASRGDQATSQKTGTPARGPRSTQNGSDKVLNHRLRSR